MPDEPEHPVLQAIAGPAPVSWSVSIRDLHAGGRTLVEHRPDDVLRTASIGKLVLLVEAAHQVVAGTLDPTEPLTRTAEDAVADSGLWQHLRTDTLPLDDVATLIGSVSDNLATNVLLRRVGLDAVGRRGTTVGLRHTALHDKVRDVRDETTPATLSTGTARELVGLMSSLAVDLADDPAAALVRRWIANSTDLSMVGGAFGLDPLAHHRPDRGITLHHKTGANADARADVGLVAGPAGRVAYAVLANWSVDDDPGTRDAVLAAMRGIGDWIRAVVSR